MSSENRKDALRTFFFSLWGLFTLVLLFIVVMLWREMLRQDMDPLASVRNLEVETSVMPTRARTTTTLGEQEVLLYFATGDGEALMPVTRSIEVTDSTTENCRAALQALILGPEADTQVEILPNNTEIRALYLLDTGELVVDLSREVLGNQQYRSASMEALMTYGVVNTLAQGAVQAQGDTPVRMVRFLFEGSPPSESFPAHIDLSEALIPDQQWVASLAEADGNG